MTQLCGLARQDWQNHYGSFSEEHEFHSNTFIGCKNISDHSGVADQSIMPFLKVGKWWQPIIDNTMTNTGPWKLIFYQQIHAAKQAVPLLDLTAQEGLWWSGDFWLNWE